MKSRAKSWYIDDGSGLEFFSLAALRFFFFNLSLSEKRDLLGLPIYVVRLDKTCEIYGYVDIRKDYPDPERLLIRKSAPIVC